MPSGNELRSEILNRLSDMIDEREDHYEGVWQEITELFLPRRADFESYDSKTSTTYKREKGEVHNSKVYDDTGIDSLKKHTDGMIGYLVNQSSVWHRLTMAQPELNDVPGVRQWLERVESILFTEYKKSNFYDAIVEVFDDGGSVGTATMTVEYDVDADVLRYMPVHPREVYIKTDKYNIVDTVYRLFWLSGKQLVDMFQENVPKRILEKIEHGGIYDYFKVLHAVFPRTDRYPGKIDKRNKAWASYYLLVDEGDSEHPFLRESGFDSMPYMVWRYRAQNHEEYGRSPAYDMKPTMVRLNQIAKTNMMAAQLNVEPPLEVPRERMGVLNLKPRGLNPYDSPDRRVIPIEIGQRQYPVSEHREEMLKQQIRNGFFVDLFLMFRSTPHEITATEAMERAGEKAAVLGAVVGRIDSELLEPLIERTYDILLKEGKIPPPPNTLPQGSGIEIQFVGPLHQLQKRFHSIGGVQKTMMQIGPIFQLKPEVADNTDWDYLYRQLTIEGGFPQKATREQSEVDQIRAVRQQQMQQQMAMQQAQQMADMVPKLNQVKQEGSVLEDVEEGLQQQGVPGA